MNVEEVRRVVDKVVEKLLLGIFGIEKVNVLKLNIVLEELKNRQKVKMKNVINKNMILVLMVIGMMCFWGSMNVNV